MRKWKYTEFPSPTERRARACTNVASKMPPRARTPRPSSNTLRKNLRIWPNRLRRSRRPQSGRPSTRTKKTRCLGRHRSSSIDCTARPKGATYALHRSQKILFAEIVQNYSFALWRLPQWVSNPLPSPPLNKRARYLTKWLFSLLSRPSTRLWITSRNSGSFKPLRTGWCGFGNVASVLAPTMRTSG